MTKIEQDLFPQGIYPVNTEILGTTDLPPVPRAFEERIRFFNSPPNLMEFLVSPRVIDAQVINTNGVLHFTSTVRPIAGYSEAALMTTAGMVTKIFDGDMVNDMIYDYPPEVQLAYWQRSLLVARNFCTLKAKGELPCDGIFDHLTPVIMSHQGRELSSYPPGASPGIKSVILPHTHIAFIDQNTIVPEEWSDDHKVRLDREAALYLRHLKGKEPSLATFVEDLNQDSRLEGFGLPLSVRQFTPIGYETQVRYDENSLPTLSKFLLAHFHDYSEQAHLLEAKLRASIRRGSFFANAIVQPAFTLFVVPLDEKKAQIIISPCLVERGGPERLGLQLQRRPDITPTYTHEQKEEFWQKLTHPNLH